ncbi:unnamed protein product [Thelazia callipaeda]|uniref:Nuclear receptor domain-containing protein n=1 Tax=Thelazia callipaeda TaxID=103827 RepID=A0A0N5D526_THECL|nr:unnamed protein product [Thelazia callipaeda]
MDAFKDSLSTVLTPHDFLTSGFSVKPNEPKVIGDRCLVCNDRHARMHYGALTCFGCKGFFRRTLKRSTQYTCRQNGTCPVDKYERNSCRFCRFKRCLEVGMDPRAVRPDRDTTGRHHVCRTRKLGSTGNQVVEEAEIGEEWIWRLPVDMRTVLMRLMNVEIIASSGKALLNATEIYPLQCGSLEDFLSDATLLNGRKTEIGYEPYRRVGKDDLVAIVHRNVLAVIDWIHQLCDWMGRISLHDKFLLTRHGFAPLMIFSTAAGTANATDDKEILCLSRLGYMPRNAQHIYGDMHYLSNGLVDQIIDELVVPLRVLKLKNEEITLMKAIIVLNPRSCYTSLSCFAAAQIRSLRDRVQETLYQVIREIHPSVAPSSRFGNLLLHFSSVAIFGLKMEENLRTLQQSTSSHTDPILYDLLMDDGIIRRNHIALSATPSLESSIDGWDGFMVPSYSNLSVSSLISQTSTSMSEFETTSDYSEDCNQSFTSYGALYEDTSQIVSIPPSHEPQYRTTPDHEVELPFSEFTTNNFTSVDQLESDPNYNITLTPNMFTEMREALNAANQIGTDSTLSTPPNSTYHGHTRYS